jgi:hypothetical protein
MRKAWDQKTFSEKNLELIASTKDKNQPNSEFDTVFGCTPQLYHFWQFCFLFKVRSWYVFQVKLLYWNLVRKSMCEKMLIQILCH